MHSAEMTPAVWSRLLAARRGATRTANGADPVTDPDPDWSPGEAAAWALYAPLAAPGGPFWYAQVGQSLDGRIATVSGDARDVSGLGGLRHLHRCRALAEAVIVGVRTALGDDPRLTVRLAPGPNPARVVIDPRARLPNDAAVFAPDGARRIVVQAIPAPRPRGVEVIVLPARDGWIDPAAIRAALLRIGLAQVLVEGGGATIAGFLEAGLLDRLHVAVAPVIIGAGPTGLRSAHPIERLSEALRPETRVYALETDVVFDCVLGPAAGSASRSQCPTSQAAAAAARA